MRVHVTKYESTKPQFRSCWWSDQRMYVVVAKSWSKNGVEKWGKNSMFLWVPAIAPKIQSQLAQSPIQPTQQVLILHVKRATPQVLILHVKDLQDFILTILWFNELQIVNVFLEGCNTKWQWISHIKIKNLAFWGWKSKPLCD